MQKIISTVTAGLAGLLLLGATSAGFAQQMQGMEGTAQQAQAAGPVEDQLGQIVEELKALRKEVAELKAARQGQRSMGAGTMARQPCGMRPPMMPPGQRSMGPGTAGEQMGQAQPQTMQPMMPMMEACGQMMGMTGQMGTMGEMAPQPQTQPEGR